MEAGVRMGSGESRLVPGCQHSAIPLGGMWSKPGLCLPKGEAQGKVFGFAFSTFPSRCSASIGGRSGAAIAEHSLRISHRSPRNVFCFSL